MPRAKVFYEAVFQVTLDRLETPDIEMWSFPMEPWRPGAGGTLVRIDGVSSGGNSTMVYYSCAACAVEAGRVAAQGGRVHREKMSIGQHGFIALAQDTGGNMIALHSMQ
jgi:predicted enzyme related to lactoylglutathione lyase